MFIEPDPYKDLVAPLGARWVAPKGAKKTPVGRRNMSLLRREEL
jgi:hypothetical protein